MTEKPVTLKDIAVETGLTIATVSRALSGKDRIAPATRETVHRAAQRLGYRPDPMLTRLAAYRSGEMHAEKGDRLAVISDFPGELPDFARRRISGVEMRAAELGYGVEYHSLRSAGGKAERLARLLVARGISGVLVERVNTPGSFAGFPWGDFAAVALGLGEEHLPLPTVTDDIYQSTRLGIEETVKRGYRRIGFLLLFGGHPDPFHRMLAAAHLEKALRAGATDMEICSLNTAGPLQKWEEQVRGLMSAFEPEVLVGSAGLYPELRRMGVRMPEDIPFAGLGSLISGEIGRRAQLSGCRPHLQDVGRVAVEMCHQHLTYPSKGLARIPVLHLVPPTWVEGGTLPVKRGGSE